MREHTRPVRAFLVCGGVGAAYGAAAGSLCVFIFFPALSAVGMVVGAIGGFFAGILGASLNHQYGWGMGGFLGGFAPYLCWPDLESLPLWLGAGTVGAIVGIIVTLELRKDTSMWPLIPTLRSALRDLEALPKEWRLVPGLALLMALVLLFILPIPH